MTEGDSQIKFHCKNCGQRISVQDKYSGRHGRCPKCKNIVVVPKTLPTEPVRRQSNSDDLKVASKSSPYDLTLLDVPPKDKPSTQPISQYDVTDGGFEDAREPQARADQTEPVPKRKLPWLIDIFLYPISKAGLTTIAVIVGVRLATALVAALLGIIAVSFPPMFVFVVTFGIIAWLVNLVMKLFACWYLCECIRDSASGGIRAPETMAVTPGLGEIFWQTLRIIGCLAFFVLPAFLYARYTKQHDAIYWGLVVYGIFFLPMGLLSVVMFDSISGLNPFLLIPSIFSTFFPYCGLVFLYAGGVLLCVLGVLVQIFSAIFSPLLSLGLFLLPVFLQFFALYVLLIAAHLLGRFYWRYQEKLNWEV